MDGVIRTYEKARKIYELYGAGDKLGLHMTAGPHNDTQELQTGAFRWLNKHLKNDTAVIEKAAVKFFEPEQLKVFDQLPSDQRNTEIHESFVPAAPPPQVPADAAAWQPMRDCVASGLVGEIVPRLAGGAVLVWTRRKPWPPTARACTWKPGTSPVKRRSGCGCTWSIAPDWTSRSRSC